VCKRCSSSSSSSSAGNRHYSARDVVSGRVLISCLSARRAGDPGVEVAVDGRRGGVAAQPLVVDVVVTLAPDQAAQLVFEACVPGGDLQA